MEIAVTPATPIQSVQAPGVQAAPEGGVQATTGASTASAPSVSPYETNRALVEQYKATLNDTSGKFSADEQLAALSSIQDLWANGQLKGANHEESLSVGQALTDSAMGKKVKALQDNYVAKYQAYRFQGGATAIRGQVEAFDSFSAEDRKILFNGGINASLMGGKPYANEADWRNVKASAYKLSKYVEDQTSQADSTSAKSEQMQKALKLLRSSQQDSAWAKQIADLFGARGEIKDRVDLSPEAQRLVGRASTKSAASASYVEGSLAKTIV